MKPLYVKKNGVVYKISGNGMPASYPAADVEYDNTVTSELQATDVQGAIDELSTRQDTNTKNTAYGTCDTAGDVKDKVATLSNATNWLLEVGTIVGVRFTYTNTYTPSSGNNVTLNVNNTGAKNIRYGDGTVVYSITYDAKNPTAFGEAGQTIYYMYDGTYWVWVSHSKDNDTLYNFKGNEFRSADENNYILESGYGGNANYMVVNGHYYYNSNGPSTDIGASANDGAIYVQAYDEDNVTQIAQNYETGNIFVRSKVNGSWTEWKKTEAIDKEIRDKADNTTTSISGNPISISGLKSNQLAVNPIITFEPIQAGSGTPSPSNIRAISGYDKIEVLSCGKNLFDISKVLVGTVSNGLWTWGGSTSKLFDLKFKANTQYTFSGYETQSGASKNVRPRIVYTDGTAENIFLVTNTTRTAFTKTSVANKTIDYIQAYWGSDSNAVVTIENFQIEEGTSATSYVPYNKVTSISESLGQTVYGGSLDVRTGVFTGTMAIKDMGDLSWGVSGSGTFHTGEIANSTKLVSSCYAYNDDSRITNNGNAELYLNNNEIAYRHGTNDRIYVKNTSYSDATAFKNAMVGQKIVYELSTPFTIQLTPHEISLLKDYAYLSTNGTSIALDYHNGELASLADVSQLGETLNSIDKSVTSGTLTDLVKQGNYGIFYYELKKSGRLVELYLELYNVRYTTLTRIANLPTGFIPAHRKIANIIAADSGTGLIQKGFMRVEVTNTGEIQAAFMGSTSENIFADVTLMYYV